jgi:hypothetical protein
MKIDKKTIFIGNKSIPISNTLADIITDELNKKLMLVNDNFIYEKYINKNGKTGPSLSNILSSSILQCLSNGDSEISNPIKTSILSKVDVLIKVEGILVPIVIFTGNENYIGSKVLIMSKVVSDYMAANMNINIIPVFITLMEELKIAGGLDNAALSYEKALAFSSYYSNQINANFILLGIGGVGIYISKINNVNNICKPII